MGIPAPMMKSCTFLVLFLGLTLYRITPPVAAEDPSIAPDFQLQSYSGETLRLADILRQKKITILNFFATWVPPCSAEIPQLIDFYAAYAGKGVNVIAIDLNETKAKVGLFIKKYRIPYTILLDYKGDVGADYDVLSIPSTFIINDKGRIVGSFNGLTSKAELESAVKIFLK